MIKIRALKKISLELLIDHDASNDPSDRQIYRALEKALSELKIENSKCNCSLTITKPTSAFASK